MRLAFVTVGDTSRATGGHLYNARVLGGLRELGVQVEEFVASCEGVDEQHAAAADLGDCLDPAAFDVVCVDALARVACAPHLDRWLARAPVVAMVHELPSAARSGERPDEEPLLRADRLVCVSSHGASILEERGVAPDLIHVVPPGLDSPPPSERERVYEEDGVLRVLCVAQWIPRKGIAELVEAWNTLRAEYHRPAAVLELIGETETDPAYADRVRGAVASADDILVRGVVGDDELRRAYVAADIFALPSTYEGYGMVYAEAMSHGLPVLALDTGPVPEVVGEAGLLVGAGDATGLVDTLHELLDDAALRRNLSGAALRRAGELSGWDSTVDGFLRALEAAVAQRSAL